jgi:hypothetical protein
MRNIYHFLRMLGITMTIILPILSLASCHKIDICENVDFKTPYKTSVQINEDIYNKVFGTSSCSPHQVELRLPVNSTISTSDKKSKEDIYTPEISTFVTFSNQNEKFSIIRLDKKENDWIYTEGDSCLAWKWHESEKKQTLTLSMERNLQIRNPDIKSVLFIVVLPLEFKESKPDLNLKFYTWDKTTSKLGAREIFQQKYYPEIRKLLRQKERGNSNDSNAFIPGEKVSKEIAEEMKSIAENGKIYLVKELASMKDTGDKQSYHYAPESPACDIPNDWKQS